MSTSSLTDTMSTASSPLREMAERPELLGNIICYGQQSCLHRRLSFSSVENKKQLIRILCEELTEDRLYHLRSTGDHKLVITGEDPCPIEVQNEEKRIRYDLETYQEEADIIIVQQVLKCVGEAQSISVISGQILMFLFCHCITTKMAGLEVPLTMESPSKERAILDIKLTQAKP